MQTGNKMVEIDCSDACSPLFYEIFIEIIEPPNEIDKPFSKVLL